MNVQNLRDNYPKLISYMETSGYSRTYTDRVYREIKRILALAGFKEWYCYTDIYLDYARKPYSFDYLRNKRTIIGVIEHFDVHGRHPDGKRRHELLKRGAYRLLSPEFKSLIDLYRENASKQGKKASTIYTESHNAATFLLALQQKGMVSLDSITEEAVLAVFMSSEGKILRSCSYKKNIAAVFKACIPHYPKTCHRILTFLPALREARNNIQYLTPEEIQKVKEALVTVDNQLALCDRAIGMLVMYTGLRSCDIAGMALDSIDWGRDLIYVKQQKTEFPIELPLTAVVGNAIYDYLTSERPHTKSRFLFVSQKKPHDRLESRSMGNISVRIMKAAGIRQTKGNRKGFHIFRHHVATTLLGRGIPQPVISRTLGHTSPNSIEVYLRADFLHLRQCSICIERFPVPKGVFSNE